jgi:hypothetical protein
VAPHRFRFGASCRVGKHSVILTNVGVNSAEGCSRRVGRPRSLKGGGAALIFSRNLERGSMAVGGALRDVVDISKAALFVHGLGERARPRALSGAPRARLVENSTGLRPHLFQLSPRGRVLVHPRAGALPGTRALSRHWRGVGMTGLGRPLRIGGAAASIL